MDSNPPEFSQALFHNCLSCVYNCDDHVFVCIIIFVVIVIFIIIIIAVVAVIVVIIIISIISIIIIISNSNWTEWSTIQGVIERVISKRARLLPELYDTRSNY